MLKGEYNEVIRYGNLSYFSYTQLLKITIYTGQENKLYQQRIQIIVHCIAIYRKCELYNVKCNDEKCKTVKKLKHIGMRVLQYIPW